MMTWDGIGWYHMVLVGKWWYGIRLYGIVWDGMGWFGEIRLNGVAWLLYTFCIDEYGEVWDGVVWSLYRDLIVRNAM